MKNESRSIRYGIGALIVIITLFGWVWNKGIKFCGSIGGLWCYPPMSLVGDVINVAVPITLIGLLLHLILKLKGGANKMNNENTIITIVVIALIILLFGGFSMMGTGNFGGMGGMMSGYYGGFGFMWLFGWLFMVLILVALVLFIVWLIRELQIPRKRK